jgi:predicted small metal-binding protein
MAKLIRCECGFIARGDDDGQVLAVIQQHIATDHPALLETVTDEDMRSWIQTD